MSTSGAGLPGRPVPDRDLGTSGTPTMCRAAQSRRALGSSRSPRSPPLTLSGSHCAPTARASISPDNVKSGTPEDRPISLTVSQAASPAAGSCRCRRQGPAAWRALYESGFFLGGWRLRAAFASSRLRVSHTAARECAPDGGGGNSQFSILNFQRARIPDSRRDDSVLHGRRHPSWYTLSNKNEPSSRFTGQHARR